MPDQVIKDIASNVRTQDNLATACPIFGVQQRRRIYGIDLDWGGDCVWKHCDGFEAGPEEAKDLDSKDKEGAEIPPEWTKTGYHDEWEFVTACFTRAGCEAYLRANGHNLRDPRIYVYSGHRNAEWEAMRNLLLSMSEEAVT